ncbi:putative Spindle pole protein [Giardia muris]|uniref:Putative Spindle pole protein n=1 Tax=Giardia muris TaxID=5742 RepID=A0A4Z1T539_GIAMU|nr:putative Spindle pole protein [Giardia muris]|eukprot:TNJ29123.1 putative Spindle pole protein [Giardia muris]
MSEPTTGLVPLEGGESTDRGPDLRTEWGGESFTASLTAGLSETQLGMFTSLLQLPASQIPSHAQLIVRYEQLRSLGNDLVGSLRKTWMLLDKHRQKLHEATAEIAALRRAVPGAPPECLSTLPVTDSLQVENFAPNLYDPTAGSSNLRAVSQSNTLQETPDMFRFLGELRTLNTVARANVPLTIRGPDGSRPPSANGDQSGKRRSPSTPQMRRLSQSSARRSSVDRSSTGSARGSVVHRGSVYNSSTAGIPSIASVTTGPYPAHASVLTNLYKSRTRSASAVRTESSPPKNYTRDRKRIVSADGGKPHRHRGRHISKRGGPFRTVVRVLNRENMSLREENTDLRRRLSEASMSQAGMQPTGLSISMSAFEPQATVHTALPQVVTNTPDSVIRDATLSEFHVQESVAKPIREPSPERAVCTPSSMYCQAPKGIWEQRQKDIPPRHAGVLAPPGLETSLDEFCVHDLTSGTSRSSSTTSAGSQAKEHAEIPVSDCITKPMTVTDNAGALAPLPSAQEGQKRAPVYEYTDTFTESVEARVIEFRDEALRRKATLGADRPVPDGEQLETLLREKAELLQTVTTLQKRLQERTQTDLVVPRETVETVLRDLVASNAVHEIPASVAEFISLDGLEPLLTSFIEEAVQTEALRMVAFSDGKLRESSFLTEHATPPATDFTSRDSSHLEYNTASSSDRSLGLLPTRRSESASRTAFLAAPIATATISVATDAILMEPVGTLTDEPSPDPVVERELREQIILLESQLYAATTTSDRQKLETEHLERQLAAVRDEYDKLYAYAQAQNATHGRMSDANLEVLRLQNELVSLQTQHDEALKRALAGDEAVTISQQLRQDNWRLKAESAKLQKELTRAIEELREFKRKTSVILKEHLRTAVDPALYAEVKERAERVELELTKLTHAKEAAEKALRSLEELKNKEVMELVASNVSLQRQVRDLTLMIDALKTTREERHTAASKCDETRNRLVEEYRGQIAKYEALVGHLRREIAQNEAHIHTLTVAAEDRANAVLHAEQARAELKSLREELERRVEQQEARTTPEPNVQMILENAALRQRVSKLEEQVQNDQNAGTAEELKHLREMLEGVEVPPQYGISVAKYIAALQRDALTLRDELLKAQLRADELRAGQEAYAKELDLLARTGLRVVVRDVNGLVLNQLEQHMEINAAYQEVIDELSRTIQLLASGSEVITFAQGISLQDYLRATTRCQTLEAEARARRVELEKLHAELHSARKANADILRLA